MHFLIKDLQILDMRHGLANTSTQAKDTNTTSLRTLGRSPFLKIEAPAAPFYWI